MKWFLLILISLSANASYISLKEMPLCLNDGPYISYANQEVCEKEQASECVYMDDHNLCTVSDLIDETDEIGFYTGKKILKISESKKSALESLIIKKKEVEKEDKNRKKEIYEKLKLLKKHDLSSDTKIIDAILEIIELLKE